MSAIAIQGLVDDEHRLSATVPGSIPPGPVVVWIDVGPQEDDAGGSWMRGISQQWAEELNDTNQDVYTLSDGEPLDPN